MATSGYPEPPGPIAGYYRHFRSGDLYAILSDDEWCVDEKTWTIHVLYRNIKEAVRVSRAYDLFFGQVEEGDYKGPRFKKLTLEEACTLE